MSGENTLQIGENYEVLSAMANLNLGPLVYLGENLSSGQVRFAKTRTPDRVIFATLEGIVQPDLLNPKKRYPGQFEQIFVSKVSEVILMRSEDLEAVEKEIYEAKTEYLNSIN